jgi:hypothetical protein
MFELCLKIRDGVLTKEEGTPEETGIALETRKLPEKATVFWPGEKGEYVRSIFVDAATEAFYS